MAEIHPDNNVTLELLHEDADFSGDVVIEEVIKQDTVTPDVSEPPK